MKLFRQAAMVAATACLASAMVLSGCSKPPVQILSAKMQTGLDKGSGNFDRVLEICFDHPLQATYYHKLTLITYQNVKIDGYGFLKPMASDPDNPCYQRNLYLYIHKDSPTDARQLIKDYLIPGNIKQVLLQIYNDKPEGKELPIAERLFEKL